MDTPPEWWVVSVTAAPDQDGHLVRYAFRDRDPIEALIPGLAPSEEQIAQLAGLLLERAPTAVPAETVG